MCRDHSIKLRIDCAKRKREENGNSGKARAIDSARRDALEQAGAEAERRSRQSELNIIDEDQLEELNSTRMVEALQAKIIKDELVDKAHKNDSALLLLAMVKLWIRDARAVQLGSKTSARYTPEAGPPLCQPGCAGQKIGQHCDRPGRKQLKPRITLQERDSEDRRSQQTKATSLGEYKRRAPSPTIKSNRLFFFRSFLAHF